MNLLVKSNFMFILEGLMVRLEFEIEIHMFEAE